MLPPGAASGRTPARVRIYLGVPPAMHFTASSCEMNFRIIRIFRFVLDSKSSSDLFEDSMSGTATRLKTPPFTQDPLAPLAEAIGLLLAPAKRRQAVTSEALSSQVSDALHRVLAARTPQSRGVRMRLIRHLADLESQDADSDVAGGGLTADDQISTAEAAEILGYSRPYVAMLIDQHKLKGATVSAGGHRRVSRAAVIAWKEEHQVTGRKTDLRATGQKLGAYKRTEADVVRRMKALAATRK